MASFTDLITAGSVVDLSNSPAYDKLAYMENKRAAITTFARYVNIAAHRYGFDGVPDTMSERVIRESLLWYPITSFFTIGDNTFCLPAVPAGRWYNAYGNFGDGFAYARNGKVYHINFDMPGAQDARFLNQTVGPKIDGDFKGVCIRENDTCIPFIYTVLFYVEQVADTIRGLENARFLLKHPVGVWTTPEQKKTWERYFKRVDENMPYVFFNKNKPQDGRQPDEAEVINFLKDGDIIKPTIEMVDWWEQRFLAECGVGNMGSQVDKKGENMIDAEVHSSDDVTNMITSGLVDYINNQLEESGVHDMPGCENLTCVERKQDEDLFRDDRGGEGVIPDNADGRDERNNI